VNRIVRGTLAPKAVNEDRESVRFARRCMLTGTLRSLDGHFGDLPQRSVEESVTVFLKRCTKYGNDHLPV
jgi:hypothetical protein